jgi:hypothetical protein
MNGEAAVPAQSGSGRIGSAGWTIALSRRLRQPYGVLIVCFTAVVACFVAAAINSELRSHDTDEPVAALAAGNLFVPLSEWSDLTFPFIVGLRTMQGKPVPMSSTINREGSCNFCHKPNLGSPLAIQGEDQRQSIGQIFVAAAPGGS